MNFVLNAIKKPGYKNIKNNMKECSGCINLKELNFPFIKKEGKYFIDQEACGIDGEDELEIKFCPVCGKEL